MPKWLVTMRSGQTRMVASDVFDDNDWGLVFCNDEPDASGSTLVLAINKDAWETVEPLDEGDDLIPQILAGVGVEAAVDALEAALVNVIEHRVAPEAQANVAGGIRLRLLDHFGEADYGAGGR